jgi:hypothetical protein
MMKSLLFVLLYAAPLLAGATQDTAYRPTTIIAVKTLGIGMKVRWTNARRLNDLLEPAGYVGIPNPVPMLSLTQSVYDPTRFGAFYSAEYGGSRSADGPKSTRINVYGGSVGLSYRVAARHRLGVTTRMGVQWAGMSVRLFDEDADTSSLQQYIHAPMPDTKHFSGNNFGLVFGIDLETALDDFLHLGLGGGYIVPVSEAGFGIDAGKFGDTPKFYAARWDVHLQLLFVWTRRRIDCDACERYRNRDRNVLKP